MNNEFCPKTYFATEKDAVFYIDKLKATSHRSKVPKRAYLCLDCHNWHLTSQDNDIDLMIKYRQKINELQKLLAEKNNIIHELKKVKAINKQVEKFNTKYRT
jgi:hypothetical protein